LLSEDPDLNYLAQKAFITYMRSVFLQKNKEVFNVEELPAAAFSKSLGLAGTPKIRFGKSKKKDKNAKREIEDDEEGEEDKIKDKKKTKMEKLFSKKNTKVLSEAWDKLRDKEEISEDEDLLVVKRKNHDIEDDFVEPLDFKKDHVVGGEIDADEDSDEKPKSKKSSKKRKTEESDEEKPKKHKSGNKKVKSGLSEEELALQILKSQT